MISLTDSEVIYLTYLELIGDEISAWLLPFDVSAARDISLSYLPSFNPAANTFRSPCSLRPRHFEWPARLPMLDLTIRRSLCINMTTSRSTFLTRQRLSYTHFPNHRIYVAARWQRQLSRITPSRGARRALLL
jgi:hypothetical protein